MRRICDLFLLIIVVPIFIFVLPILIVLKYSFDGSPIFYISNRVGRNMSLIRIYKFRTMVNDRYFIETEVNKYKDGFEVIPLSSPIYTKLGVIYEKFQLVELPQLINILKGEMSFVGYRPLPFEHIKNLQNSTSSDLIFSRHTGLPGLTGITQLIGKSNIDKYMRLKIEVDENHFFNKNSFKVFCLYFLIIFLTLPIVLNLLDSRFILHIYVKYIKS